LSLKSERLPAFAGRCPLADWPERARGVTR